jgi:hypothetical protein
MLAEAHFQVEPCLKDVFVLEPFHDHDPRDPIRLLEVVEGTIERGFEPVAFAPDPAHGIDYPSWVFEISPSEYQSVMKNDGRFEFRENIWTLGEQVPRS